MHSYLSWPYAAAPHPQPYWGEQTSAVNFCEEDYIVTYYIAEFFNTLTSLLYIVYGIHGIHRSKPHSLFSSPNLPYWGLIGVGLCSSAYHLSLKYHTQMSDELSMHVAIGTVLHQVFTFQQPPQRQRLVRIILLSILVPFYIYHCVADEFAVHVVLFLSMVLTVIWKTSQLVWQRIKDPEKRRRLSALTSFATVCALTAYALWNVDVHLCSHLTQIKRRLGYPWGVLLELHGWWHVLTAGASYTFLAVIEVLTTAGEEGVEKGKGFAWPAGEVLEELAGSVGESAGAAANGHAKGGKVANGKAS